MSEPAALAAPTRSQNANKELIDTLRRSKLFRSYERVFSEATGLPLTLRPMQYWQLEHHGKTHENAFCALLAERPKTLRVCLQAHEEMVRRVGDRPLTIVCPYGLTESAVPVKLGQQTVGFLRIGQVLRRSREKSDTRKATSTLHACGVPFTGALARAWERNPLIPREKYSGIVRLLTFFADQLSALCNQIMVERRNAEPPIVQKARNYIEQHKHDQLPLAEVANAAGASVFHFCKVFHKATGLKFTDYVARMRLEEARTQLLNPNRRISEVAYDVGFQSLTQFNRTFKRVFGQSPSGFREHLSSNNASPRTRQLVR